MDVCGKYQNKECDQQPCDDVCAASLQNQPIPDNPDGTFDLTITPWDTKTYERPTSGSI